MNRPVRFKQLVRGSGGKISWYEWGFIAPGRFEPPIMSNGSYQDAIKNSFQATGLHDRNKTEIYEADILEMEIQTAIGIVRAIGVMMWIKNRAAFSIEIPTDFDLNSLAAEGEKQPPLIIGNLIENPELTPKKDSILGL